MPFKIIKINESPAIFHLLILQISNSKGKKIIHHIYYDSFYMNFYTEAKNIHKKSRQEYKRTYEDVSTLPPLKRRIKKSTVYIVYMGVTRSIIQKPLNFFIRYNIILSEGANNNNKKKYKKKEKCEKSFFFVVINRMYK